MRPCARVLGLPSSSWLSSSSSPLLRPPPPPPAPISEFGHYFPLYPQHDKDLTAFPAPHLVPSRILRPHYVPADFWSRHTGAPPDSVPPETHGGKIKLGGDEERGVRAAAQLAKRVLDEARKLVKPGVTTAEIDRVLHELILSHGAYPSPLGYSKFPKSVCTSINNVIAHGIPDDRPLHPTDLINIDITVFLNGYHGDTSRTFCLPEVDEEGIELCEVTKESLEAGISVCGPGVPLSEIARKIEEVTDRYGYIVSDLFSGHGIGRTFHHAPYILHTLASATEGKNKHLKMEVGDCFTIEPSVEQVSESAGMGEMWADGWTVVTKSGSRSAQFEHQLLITPDGYSVLTR